MVHRGSEARKARQPQANQADSAFNIAYPEWNKDFVLSTLLGFMVDAFSEKAIPVNNKASRPVDGQLTQISRRW